MTTNRKAVKRRPTPRITPRAIALFDRLRRLECTCEPRDRGGKYWEHTLCAGCEEHGRLMGQLHTELQLRPWQDAVADPDAGNPYPIGTYAARSWRPDVEAVERWKALARASREQRRAKRMAKASERAAGDAVGDANVGAD
jgi:hypothetical protein